VVATAIKLKQNCFILVVIMVLTGYLSKPNFCVSGNFGIYVLFQSTMGVFHNVIFDDCYWCTIVAVAFIAFTVLNAIYEVSK